MSRSMMKMKRQLQIKQQFKFNEWNYDEGFQRFVQYCQI